MENDGIMRLCDASEFFHDKSADGIAFGIDVLGAEFFGQFAQERFAFDEPRAVLSRFYIALLFGVEFVFDIADERFEGVFDRQQPRRSAVFVDDDRQMTPFLLQLFERMPDGCRFGDIHDFPHDGLQRCGGIFFLRGDGVFDVYESHDIVEVISVDGISGMSFFEGHGNEIVEGRVGADAVDLPSGDHDFARVERGELEDVFEQRAGFFRNGAVVLRMLGDVSQFFGRHAGAVSGLRGFDARQPHQCIARDDEQIHHRTEHGVKYLHRHRHKHADFERFCDGDAFGREFAADDMGKRSEAKGQDKACGVRDFARNRKRNPIEKRRQMPIDGRFCQPPDAEACDGDAELNGRQVRIEVMNNFYDAPGGAVAFIFENFELRNAHADERKFGGDKKSVAKQKKNNEEKFYHKGIGKKKMRIDCPQSDRARRKGGVFYG